MDIKKLEKKITQLKAVLKTSDADDLKTRILKKVLKRAQRRIATLKAKAAMVAAKAAKKVAKEEAA